MVAYDFNKEKNELVKREHGISFEEVIQALQKKKVLAKFAHPNKRKYPNQWIVIVEIKGYAVVVPHIERKESIFLKTAFYSRKYTNKFIKRKENHEKKI